jgi:hypothetical protein
MATVAHSSTAQQHKALHQAILSCAQQVDWRDRGQTQAAMDLVLAGRVELQDDPALGIVRDRNYTWTVTREQGCACGEPLPCTHLKAIELQHRVNTALLQPEAADPWAEAVLHAAKDFRQAHPEVDQGRLGRGVDLATTHAVAFRTDGSAMVSNGCASRPRVYAMGLDGTCGCEDVKKRGVRWCKHGIAVELTLMAKRDLDEREREAEPEEGPPERPSADAVAEEMPEPVVTDCDMVEADTALPIALGLAPQDQGRALEPVPVQTSALTWSVNEAPAVAWFKWRIGNSELFFSFRGLTDAEVTHRVVQQMPVLEDLVHAAEVRQAEAD